MSRKIELRGASEQFRTPPSGKIALKDLEPRIAGEIASSGILSPWDVEILDNPKRYQRHEKPRGIEDPTHELQTEF